MYFSLLKKCRRINDPKISILNVEECVSLSLVQLDCLSISLSPSLTTRSHICEHNVRIFHVWPTGNYLEEEEKDPYTRHSSHRPSQWFHSASMRDTRLTLSSSASVIFEDDEWCSRLSTEENLRRDFFFSENARSARIDSDEFPGNWQFDPCEQLDQNVCSLAQSLSNNFFIKNSTEKWCSLHKQKYFWPVSRKSKIHACFFFPLELFCRILFKCATKPACTDSSTYVRAARELD